MTENINILLENKDNSLTIIALELKHIGERLDGHGKKIDNQSNEIKAMRDESTKTKEELKKDIYETRVQAADANWKTRMKTVAQNTGISSFVSFITTLLTIWWKTFKDS